jgi:hypothetical protein
MKPNRAEDVVIRAEVMVRQADALAGDLRELTDASAKGSRAITCRMQT